MARPDCPSNELLLQWYSGRIAENAAEPIDEHVIECRNCWRLLSNFQDPDSLQRSLSLNGEHLYRSARAAFEPFRERMKFDPTHQSDPFKFEADHLSLYRVGDRLGRYLLEGILGQGGMGRVFRAWDEQLKRQVAIKVIRQERYQDNAQEMFLHEARVAAQLRHPNVVPVYSVETTDSRQPYLVMEYIRGGSLAEHLKSGLLLDHQKIAVHFEQAARGLSAIHAAGIVHRDIKPANVLLDAETDQARITDFGLAVLSQMDDGQVSQRGLIVGTPAYMSPEAVRGDQILDCRHDLYGLGVMLYEVLTGELPFRGTTEAIFKQIQQTEPSSPRTLRSAIPAGLEAICQKAMARERSRRYQDAGELADDLLRWQRGEPLHARPSTRFDRFILLMRRNPLPSLLAGSLACTLLTGFAVAIVQWHENRQLAAQETKLRADAERRLQMAANAIDMFSIRILDDPWLDLEVRSIEHRGPLLREAVSLYVSLLEAESDRPELKSRAAETAYRAARLAYGIRQNDGSSDHCDVLVEKALLLCGEMHMDTPNNTAVINRLVTLFQLRGSLQLGTANFDEAAADLLKAESLAQELSSAEPDNHEYRRLLANVIATRGNLAHTQNDHDNARTLYKLALDLCSVPHHDPTGQRLLIRDRARLLNNLARVCKPSPEKSDWLKQSLELRQELVKQSPRDSVLRAELADVLTAMAADFYAQRRPNEALPLAQRACQEYRQAQAYAPLWSEALQQWLLASNLAASLLSEQANPSEFAIYAHEERLIEELLLDEDLVRNEAAVLNSRWNRGLEQSRRKTPLPANAVETAWQPFFQTAANRLDAAPQDSSCRSRIAAACDMIGLAHLREQNLNSAELWFRKSWIEFQRVAAEQPNVLVEHFRCGGVGQRLGFVLLQLNRPDEAEEILGDTLPYLERCWLQDTSKTSYRRAFADSHLNLGRISTNQASWKNAARHFGAAGPLLHDVPHDQFEATDGLRLALDFLSNDTDSHSAQTVEEFRPVLAALVEVLRKQTEFNQKFESDSLWRNWIQKP